jgi:hypothetical protein
MNEPGSRMSACSMLGSLFAGGWRTPSIRNWRPALEQMPVVPRAVIALERIPRLQEQRVALHPDHSTEAC